MSDLTINTHGDAGFGDYVALLKPRVMSLAVFTALVGLIVAPGSVHPVEAFASVLFIALGAGAAGALNMWWDSDIDALMKRTRNRPIPSGRVAPGEALQLGLWLSGLSVVMLMLSANIVAAGLLAFTIFFYVVVYSMLLKRRTPSNIVIGGAAGALPPVVGWSVAAGAAAPEPMLMFAIVFLWTPPHFWALALFVKTDYDLAGVPMLTVTHGRAETRSRIFVYAAVLAPVALVLGFTSVGGPAYIATSLIMNALFLRGAWKVRNRSEDEAAADGHAAEKSLFRLSLIYLFLHFGALLADKALRAAGVA